MSGRATLRLLAALLTAGALALIPAATNAQSLPAQHYAGVLPDGGQWIADVPTPWNGRLILYSHGYGSRQPADSPDPNTQQALLNEGYALTGSSYDPTGSLWQLGSAVRDQFETLSAVETTVLHARPRETFAFGTSMGGLISALEDQSSNGRLQGALTTCGIVAGGIQLGNYQLDGEYTIAKLLAPDQPIKLVRFNNIGESVVTANQLTAAATAAQQTAAGRARLALALSLMNTTTWAPGQPEPTSHDPATDEQQQYLTMFGAPAPFPVMLFIETGRQQIEQAAGGNPAWTAGVNFFRLFEQSSYRHEIEALYRAAGLSLREDLSTLTRGANIKADTNAVRWMYETSVPSGRLQVPELDLHTISDQLVPVQQENYYAHTVWRAWSGSLLRQAFVERSSHCNFTPAELVAGVHAVQSRFESGRWDDLASPSSLNAEASRLNLGGSAFIWYYPPPLSGDNGPFNPWINGTGWTWDGR